LCFAHPCSQGSMIANQYASPSLRNFASYWFFLLRKSIN
jgi:hypothetical protein